MWGCPVGPPCQHVLYEPGSADRDQGCKLSWSSSIRRPESPSRAPPAQCLPLLTSPTRAEREAAPPPQQLSRGLPHPLRLPGQRSQTGPRCSPPRSTASLSLLTPQNQPWLLTSHPARKLVVFKLSPWTCPAEQPLEPRSPTPPAGRAGSGRLCRRRVCLSKSR